MPEPRYCRSGEGGRRPGLESEVAGVERERGQETLSASENRRFFFGGGLLIRPASVFNRFLEWLPPP